MIAREGLQLRLYVAGDSPNSLLARRNLDAVLAELQAQGTSLELIDVLREPERGLRDRILATPTLVRATPLPELRIIGTLRDRELLVRRLGLGELLP
jgi:circadian clock protein KaiB